VTAGSSCSLPPASWSTPFDCRTSTDGNGVGVPAAPSLGDLDGDGRRPRIRRVLDGLTAAFLVAFRVRLASEHL